MWPVSLRATPTPPRLAEVVHTLNTPRASGPAGASSSGWLDASDASVRFALLKLITGGLRVGVSARLAKTGARGADRGPHRRRRHRGGLARPRAALPAAVRLDRGQRPAPRPRRRARSSARPCWRIRWRKRTSRRSTRRVLRAEWKWDGIRVQLVATAGGRRLYSRGADDISDAFPEIVEAMQFQACSTASCWCMRDGQVAPFSDLQQRLNRKRGRRRCCGSIPAAVRLYDMLFEGDGGSAPAAVRRAPRRGWRHGTHGRARRAWTSPR